MTIRIGNLTLKKPYVLAPMAGITDHPFRVLVRRFGAELCYTEMISAEAFVRGGRKTHLLLKTTPEDSPTGAQIVGARAESMAESARKLEAMGFPLADINIGCPARKVTKQGSGSALLKDASRFEKIIHAVKGAVKIPVTIKLRSGYDEHSEKDFIQLLKIAEAAGVAAITVHGRTQKQQYKGTADLAPIRLAKKSVHCPVFGNGDITSGERALRMIKETGCDGVMIGRGAIGNPWIFREIEAVLAGSKDIPKPTVQDKIQIFDEHLTSMMEWYDPKHAVILMRKFVPYYFSKIPGAAEVRKLTNLAKTQAEMRQALQVLIDN